MLHLLLSRTCYVTRFILFLTISLLCFAAYPAQADEPGVPDNTPTRLVINSISLDSSIVPVGWKPVVVNGKTYGQWETVENLVGWHNLSARPGQVGNTVLAGHSDIYARVFRNLIGVTVGDEIVVFAGEQAYHYVVVEKFLVKEKGASLQERIENARWIAPTADERLTLVTCTNPGATHRLIVIARPAGAVAP